MDIKQLIKKILNKETILYIVFGVITTIVDFLVFSIFYYGLSIDEVISNTIAWFAAVVVAFITNKLIVFNSKGHEAKELIKEIASFFLARVTSLIITDVFLVFAAHINMNMLLAKAFISVAVIVINYFFSKLFIFKK
ncbi:MAG: GtrA family protein [Lachnospiraceae bacterium]|nr:GtrA family protein [Lachnospiraceae bacterium]